LAAFNSAVSGPAGSVQKDTVRMTSMSVIDRPLFKLSPPTATAPVALVQSALGDDGRILSLTTAAGYRGLVIEALGGGSVPSAWVAGLKQLVRAVPVVYSPRTFAGPTLRSTYGSTGGELDLRRMGIIPSGLLDSLKSRLLLQLLLTTEADAGARERAFAMFDQPRTTGDRPGFLTAHAEAKDSRLAR
jgi:L-asparaginase